MAIDTNFNYAVLSENEPITVLTMGTEDGPEPLREGASVPASPFSNGSFSLMATGFPQLFLQCTDEGIVLDLAKASDGWVGITGVPGIFACLSDGQPYVIQVKELESPAVEIGVVIVGTTDNDIPEKKTTLVVAENA